jgi:CIC family chloride channel protein
LGTGAVAVAVVRVFLGRDVNFLVGQLPAAHFEDLFLYLPLGCAIGLIGNLHVHTIVTVVGLFQHPRLPSVARGALVGAAIGLLAWMSPSLVGSGDGLIQRVIDSKFVLSGLALMFLVRFFLGPLSLAADTPGGYFTPVLLLGALSGAIYGDLVSKWLPAAPPPTAFALVGMAVALATIARAPFTGVLLAMETTGTYVMGLPMIMAVFGSLAVVHLLHSPAIGTGLEALRTRLHKR